VLEELEAVVTGARRSGSAVRLLATLLVTDIVGSTDRAAELGDRRWRLLLDDHDRIVREELARHGGVEVNTAGDGFLARFELPGRAIACALAIRERVHDIGLSVRAGLHAGEVEVRGADLGGMAVHIAARVSSLADDDEVLATKTVADLVVGSGLGFSSRGAHELKGVPGTWDVVAVGS
jgi:class 3 adenylate cyclase